MLETLADAFKLFAEAFAGSSGSVRAAIMNWLVGGLLISILYLGSFCIREESVTKGFYQAYTHSWLSDESIYTQIHSQAELEASAVSARVSRHILEQARDAAPNAARVRLSLIHDGITTINGVDLMRFDVVSAVAGRGRDVGEMQQNRPLSEWSPDYLPSLLRHECKYMLVEVMQNITRRERLESMGAVAVLGCPVLDTNGQIFGSIFVAWDDASKLPTEDFLKGYSERLKGWGAQIGAALDMQRSAR